MPFAFIRLDSSPWIIYLEPMRIFLLLAASLCFIANPVFAADKWVSLFDGKSFNGWEGNLAAFRIQDGAIVGGNMDEKIPRNEFLCTARN